MRAAASTATVASLGGATLLLNSRVARGHAAQSRRLLNSRADAALSRSR